MKKLLIGFLMFFAAAPAYAETSSLAALLSAGQSVECDYSSPDGTRGTVQLGQGRMRNEALVNENGSVSTMHMISDGLKMYMWGGPMGERQGMIMSINPNAPSPMGGPQGPDMNAEMDFSCRPWAVDSSRFTPPSDVQFQDMAAMMATAYAGIAEAQQQ